MDCGDAGHILLSGRVADDLGQFGRWQPQLHDLGEVEVKHGVRLDVVNLYTESVGNARLEREQWCDHLRGSRIPECAGVDLGHDSKRRVAP